MMSDSAWTVGGGTDPSTSSALAGEGERLSASFPKKLQPDYSIAQSQAQDPQDQATNNIISDININDLDIDGIIDDMGFFGSSAEEAGIPSLSDDEEQAQGLSGNGNYNGGLTPPSSGSSSSSSSLNLNLNLEDDNSGGLLTTASGSSSLNLNLEGDVGEGGLTTASRSSSSLSLNLGLDICFAVSVSNEGSNISGSTASGSSDVSSETTEQQQDYCFPSNLDSGLPSIMEQTQEDLQDEEQQQQEIQPHVVSRQQYSTQQIISSALNAAAASPVPMQVQQQQQQIQYVPQQQQGQQAQSQEQVPTQQVQQVVQPTPFAGGEIARRLLSLQPSQQTPNPLLGHHQQYQQQQLQHHQQNCQQQVQQQQQVIPNPLLHPVMVYQQVPQVQRQQQQQQQQQSCPQVVGLAAASNLITPSSSLSSSMSLSRTKRLSSSTSSSSHNNINNNSNNHNAAFQLNPSASVPASLLSCNNYNNTNTNNNNSAHNAVFNLTPSSSVPSSLLSVRSNTNNSGNNNHNAVFTNVLEQQRETIARNQQIIDAQNNKLGQVAAKYSTIQDAAVAIIKNKKNVDNVTTVKKVGEESNSYLKWKCTTAGASNLKALENISDDTLITSSVKSSIHSNSIKKKTKKTNVVISSKGRQQPQQLQVHPSQQQSLLFGNVSGMGMGSINIPNHHGGRHIMKPELLEARRERNRKHAKKSRQRKKSLTTDLEQSLEDLKEENQKLRKCIEESFERKKMAKKNMNLLTTPDNVDSNADAVVAVATTAPTTERTVDELLESRRVRSHERFIQCIMDDTNYTNQDTDDDNDDKAQQEGDTNNDLGDTVDKDGTLPPLPSTSSIPTTTMGSSSATTTHSVSSFLSSSPSTRSGKGVILNEKTLKILKALSKTIICVPTISSQQQEQDQQQEPQSPPPACKRQKLMTTTTPTTTMLSS